MRMFAWVGIVLLLAACGGGAGNAPGNEESAPKPLPRAEVGGKVTEFPVTKYELNKKDRTVTLYFRTNTPGPQTPEEMGVVPDPPTAGLSFTLKDVQKGFFVENVERVHLVMANVPGADGVILRPDAKSGIKSMSGDVYKDSRIKLEFDWSDDKASFKADIDGNIR